MKTWAANRADLARPIAVPLGRAAELLGVDLVTISRAARRIEPYRRADGESIWSLHLLEVELKASVDDEGTGPPEIRGAAGSSTLDGRRGSG